jgi:hypothetical protein
MNSLQKAREGLGLDEEEFALLLGWSRRRLRALEITEEGSLNTLLLPFIETFTDMPRPMARALLERRHKSPKASDREALARLSRKLNAIA